MKIWKLNNTYNIKLVFERKNEDMTDEAKNHRDNHKVKRQRQ